MLAFMLWCVWKHEELQKQAEKVEREKMEQDIKNKAEQNQKDQAQRVRVMFVTCTCRAHRRVWVIRRSVRSKKRRKRQLSSRPNKRRSTQRNAKQLRATANMEPQTRSAPNACVPTSGLVKNVTLAVSLVRKRRRRTVDALAASVNVAFCAKVTNVSILMSVRTTMEVVTNTLAASMLAVATHVVTALRGTSAQVTTSAMKYSFWLSCSLDFASLCQRFGT